MAGDGSTPTRPSLRKARPRPSPVPDEKIRALRALMAEDAREPADLFLRGLPLLIELDAQQAERDRERREAAAGAKLERAVRELKDGRPKEIAAALKLWKEAGRDLGLPEAPALPSAGDRVRNRIGAPPVVHVPTGLATLDSITRGGPMAGRVVVIGGAPDTGKTSLAVQIAVFAARAGYGVAIHCVDEDREGIECRIGQAHELALEDLEQGVPDALDSLAARLDELPGLLIVDQDDDGLKVEDTAAALMAHTRRLHCRAPVLVIDSLQTAITASVTDNMLDKERADAVTATVKRIAKRTGALVIITSELNRNAYRAPNAKDRGVPMASFKGSGAIEYAMTLGLVLSKVQGEPDLIHVDVPKNKRGRSLPFRLSRDPRRCSYTDMGPDMSHHNGDNDGADPPKIDPRGEKDVERARHLLKANPGKWNVEELVTAIGGKTAWARKAVNKLKVAGEVKTRPRGGGMRGVVLFHVDSLPEQVEIQGS